MDWDGTKKLGIKEGGGRWKILFQFRGVGKRHEYEWEDTLLTAAREISLQGWVGKLRTGMHVRKASEKTTRGERVWTGRMKGSGVRVWGCLPIEWECHRAQKLKPASIASP